MSDFFDIYNLVILAIAVAIFLRLRSVLGRRTGNERQPYDPFATEKGREGGSDNVVSLPRTNGSNGPAVPSQADVTTRLEGVAKQGTPLFDWLHAIVEADPSFDPKTFISGASMAYEMIVTAFANGDRETLAPLLSPDVMEGFDGAISAREASGSTMSTTLIGIEKIAITDAILKSNAARVTVRVESQMITATYNKDGALTDGDPNKVVDVVDVWTFERDVTSGDPNWMLVATESA